MVIYGDLRGFYGDFMGFDDFMGFVVIQWNIDGIHSLVMTNIAIENGQ